MKDSPFNAIHLRLVALAAERGSMVVGVFGTARGAGTSTVVAGLARSFAEVDDGRVLVIDASPSGRRRVSQLLRARTSPAREAGDETPQWPDADIVPTQEAGIDVLTIAGGGPIRLNDAPRWSRALAALKARYQLVIVDLGPAASSAITSLHPLLDQSVLVVDTTRTTTESLSRLRKDLDDAGIRLGGFVLNKRRFHVPGFLYRFVY